MRTHSRSQSITPSGARTPRPGISKTASSHSTVKSRDMPMQVKKFSLTSKANWWLVEVDEENAGTANSFSSTETLTEEPEEPVSYLRDISPSPPPSPLYKPHAVHPSGIFSFPTPLTHAAPPNPTAHMSPFASGSTAELFKSVVKRPQIMQLEINGERQSNAADVTAQFLAELRVYTSVTRHRNIVGFLGCVEGVGMVLEYIEGRTLLEAVRARPPLPKSMKIDYHNQLLDGLDHLHSFGLSHGDLSLLNAYVTPNDTIKLLDFGRSVASTSYLASPEEEPIGPTDPFAQLRRHNSQKFDHQRETIHPGTRPFTAPEILRGECLDARLADAYSFGMVLCCIDLCELIDVDPFVQKRDEVPMEILVRCTDLNDNDRILAYLRPRNKRRRISKSDLIHVKRNWW